MAVKSSLEILETDLVKHLSEIQAKNIKWIILIPPEEPQQICEIWLILTNISYEIENMSTPPHKIGFIKTSARKKSNQLESLPSWLFLATSDPAPAYTQLCCITKSELAIPHSFSSLPMCVIPTISPKQTCPQSHRMLVTEPKHSQPQRGWNTTFPQRSSGCSTDFQEGNSSILSPSNILTHASLLKLLCFLLQKGIYWTSQATICHVSRWTPVCCSLKGLFAT